MEANYVQRIRMTFSKDGPARYISHLDLARTLERALNRAQIPVAYTLGFNRRPRMQLASALPLGYTSSYEMADILLGERMEPETVQSQLMAKMAPGITITAVKEVPTGGKSLPALTEEATYTARPLDPVNTAELRQQIARLLAADAVRRERGHGRKRKEYDLRPLILDLQLADEPESPLLIEMRLLQQPSMTGRPDEVLRELGLDPLDAHIHRQRLVLQDET